MVQVKLERFSGPKAPKQGWELTRLVQNNADWLRDTSYADDIERFGRGLGEAVLQVTRIASFSGLYDPYLIHLREDGHRQRPVGVGAVRRGQKVIIPDYGELIEGADADYWLDQTAEKEVDAIHHLVGEVMLRQAVQNIIDRDRPDNQLMVFATMEPDKPHQPVGFSSVMETFETSGKIYVDDPTSDTFGQPKGGRELDLMLYERWFRFDPFARPDYY